MLLVLCRFVLFLYSNNSQSIETWLKMVLFGKEYLAVGHLVKHFDTFPLVFQNLSDSTLLVKEKITGWFTAIIRTDEM